MGRRRKRKSFYRGEFVSAAKGKACPWRKTERFSGGKRFAAMNHRDFAAETILKTTNGVRRKMWVFIAAPSYNFHTLASALLI